MKISKGFTLIELMVTIAVIAIMAGLAVPRLNNFMRSNRLTSQINSFISALQLARSEAVKRGAHVVLCASTDQQNCNTTQWEQGWIVFVDTNTTKPFTFATPTKPTKSDILRVGGQLSGNDTLRDSLSTSGTTSTGAIIYKPSGAPITSTANNTGNTFTLCDPGDASDPNNATDRQKRARAVNIKISGLISLATDTDSPPDGIVDDYTNTTNVKCP
jgi:type IV fimbrial biogenesis protein FimT